MAQRNSRFITQETSQEAGLNESDSVSDKGEIGGYWEEGRRKKGGRRKEDNRGNGER